METLELCRLCALEKDNLLSIFDSEGSRLTLDVKIKRCLNIEVTLKEHFPKSICMDCYTKLDAFEEFLDLSMNAQATLSILYSVKKEKLPALTLTDGGEKREVEGDFENDNEQYILDDVPTSAELEIKNDFIDASKTFIESQDVVPLETCNEPDDLLPEVDNEFPQEKSEEEDKTEDCGGDGEGNFQTWTFPANWLCSDCSERFQDPEELQQHQRTMHNQDVRYTCEFCSQLFIELELFLSHVKRHQSSLKYRCDVCDKWFSNRKEFEAHNSVHNNKPYVCSECGKTFRQQSALLLHARCHLPEDVRSKYPCELCNKRFSSKPNLLTHMRIHNGVRNFTCDQCGKSFIQKGNLEAHLLTHSIDKPFECETCNKRFKSAMQLRKHHSVHTGAKPHQCDICGRTFREKGTLREHHRIHTGAMPFTCEYCGKAFRFKGILTTHRRQHTGERPYSCLECEHHFTNWPNYNKHMKRRHGINTSRSLHTKHPTPAANPVQAAPSEVSTPAVPQQQDSQQEVQLVHQVSQVPLHSQSTLILPSNPIYQEIQQNDVYSSVPPPNLGVLPTYMAYNVYSLSQVTGVDGTTIEIMPRQTIALKDSPIINFPT